MSVSLFHRRKSERFAELIDEAGGGRRHHTRSVEDDQFRSLVGLTNRVAALPLTVEAHPEFRDGLRAMLMATIEREGIGATATADAEDSGESVYPAELARIEARRSRRRARAFGALVTGLAAGVIALSGVSTASENSAPGDALYGFKRSTERAQLALTVSDAKRGQLDLDFAKTRLDEARAIRGDLSRFTKVMDEMDQETIEGVRLLTTEAMERRDGSPLDAIDAFTASQRQGLERLKRELTSGGYARAIEASALLSRVADRSAALRPLLQCGTAATGDADNLGPTPKLTCEAGKLASDDPPARGGESPQPEVSSSADGSGADFAGARPAVPTPGASVSTRPLNPSGGTAGPLEGARLSGEPCDVVGCSPS